MRIVWRVLGVAACMLIVGLTRLAIGVARTWDRVYDAPLPAVGLSRDPAVLARGEYLVFGPGHCVECHGQSSANETVASPWEAFARMAPEDLGARYEFLRSRPPQGGPTGETTFTQN